MAKRRQAKEEARARIERMRAEQRARERRRRIAWFGGGGAVVAALVAVIVVAVASTGGGGGSGHEVIPASLTGTPVVQPPPLKVPNTTGIKGIVAYDTTGWPTDSHNGPKNRALRHAHVPGPVTYAVTPPVGGDHNATWMNCGVYAKAVPNEHAVHDLEHGAIWITYQPSLPGSEVRQLRAFFKRQSVLSSSQGSSRYVDVSPYPGLPAPIVASSWGFQVRLHSPTDPRLQQFVSKFRVSKQYTPEYGGPCTGGIGTPLEK